MAESGPYTFPWYATLFRGEQFEAALLEIAPIALRYGATELPRLPVPRRPLQVPPAGPRSTKLDWEQYWYGAGVLALRAEHSGWYQVPVVYAPAHEIASGALEHESVELDV